jgi:hypothetical protein
MTMRRWMEFMLIVGLAGGLDERLHVDSGKGSHVVDG